MVQYFKLSGKIFLYTPNLPSLKEYPGATLSICVTYVTSTLINTLRLYCKEVITNHMVSAAMFLGGVNIQAIPYFTLGQKRTQTTLNNLSENKLFRIIYNYTNALA